MFGAGTLREAPDGGWRVLLDSATFGGEVKVARVGSCQFSDHHFIQIWCTDPAGPAGTSAGHRHPAKLLDQDTEGARSWSLPGGKVEPGETIEEALER